VGSGRELLGDAGIAEADRFQLLGLAVLQAKDDGVARVELEVLDGFVADQQRVGLGGQSADQGLGRSALEVRVLQARGSDDRARPNAVQVLQVGSDVHEAVLDGLDTLHALDPCETRCSGGTDVRPGRLGDRHVGAVRELSIDLGLLTVGRVEHGGGRRKRNRERDQHQCARQGTALP